MLSCQGGTRCSHNRVAREPVTAVEGILCESFADALGVCRIGADDDFFDLGGDHPSAVDMIAVLAHQIGIGVPLQWLEANPTPATLAKQVRRDIDVRMAATGFGC